MIHVFFVPGMFGSTIEYVLRNYTNEYETVPGRILDNGSLHVFAKQAHLTDLSSVYNLSNKTNKSTITTPIYPFNKSHLPEILTAFESVMSVDDRCVLLYAENLADAEINILFQYHKICVGLNKTLEIFCSNNTLNIVNWNKDYQHWKDMQDWELREWFSLFYVSWIQEWIDSQTQVPADWLKIRNVDFLNQPEQSLDTIIKFCNLTPKSGIEEFFREWKQKQQYVIGEMELINSIVKSTVEQTQFAWQPLNIIAESMIQQKLRSKGYEIRCDGLNTFPTNTETLYNLLEKC
jgi:hypothetical protein